MNRKKAALRFDPVLHAHQTEARRTHFVRRERQGIVLIRYCLSETGKRAPPIASDARKVIVQQIQKAG